MPEKVVQPPPSPEQIRCHAVEAAIKLRGMKPDPDPCIGLLNDAKTIENYIVTGAVPVK
jgi:hypothetical protein